jgi:hypothetical protein
MCWQARSLNQLRAAIQGSSPRRQQQCCAH